MSKILRTSLLAGSATLGLCLVSSGNALADPSTGDLLQQVESYSLEMEEPVLEDTEAQFTGASKFSDVSPGDWAFQALDDLVQRYDCLKGYPNGTYRGNRALTRYEFAAGLNACLQQIERLIAETTGEFTTREDLAVLRRLMEEFEQELALLGVRVDNLEGRVAFLEDNQFSTTTRLNGVMMTNLDIATGDRAKIFGLNGAEYFDLGLLDNLGTLATPASVANIIDQNRMIGLFEEGGTVDSITLGEYLAADSLAGGTVINAFINDLATIHAAGNDTAGNFRTDRNNALAFGYRARLAFDTSFTGRDRLRIRLQARNLQNLKRFGTGTEQSVPNFYGFAANNNVGINKVHYRFPASDNVVLHVGAAQIVVDDIIDSHSTSPYALTGIPLGLAYNNLLFESQGIPGAAIGANIRFNEMLGLDIAYIAQDANDANLGIFGGSFILPIQLNVKVGNDVKLAFAYARSFAPGGLRTDENIVLSTTGSVLGQSPFLWVDSSGNIRESATSANHYHFAGTWDISDDFNISGYLGYLNGVAESGVRKGDNADMWTWGLNLAFPDMFKENDVIVAGFGMLPYLASADNGPSDRSPSYMANLEYRFPLTDNIEIAPAIYAVFNPNGNPNNDTIFAGMIRTLLKF
ncbi:iron uptake porin [Spirulina sp. 06S082]|uniref:iron uptake porin n=1 Tax=Spirulina sp. 06S082 TaxID=3110248 RepID=UPI002B20E0F7|nr:iron uptake porin [Spirulina sp. 06S082]MEA5469643.1 iron uptake porin [Spirulina sp. 06S082]